MFNTIYKSTRSSDAVLQLRASIVDGFVLVTFKNGDTYAYNNVSRRAILNLMMNKNMSLGFWVNENCVNAKRALDANITGIVPTMLTFA